MTTHTGGEMDKLRELSERMRACGGKGATGVEAALHQYADELDALRAQLAGGGWISVEDRKPAEDEPVWCWKEGTSPFIGGYCDSGEGWAWMNCYGSHYLKDGAWTAFDFEWDDQYDVTHWQPLPTPPLAPTKETES